jgi:hypothetical protein
MSLIPQSIEAAAAIGRINETAEANLRLFLRDSYSQLWSTGNPQEVLDVLGENAATALMRYAVFHQALTAIGGGEGLPAPDSTIYVVNSNGSVTYVAPPEPEPQPEPEAEPGEVIDEPA